MRAWISVLVVIGCLSFASVAYAYEETISTVDPANCAGCHGVTSVSVEANGFGRQGPHANYSMTSNACEDCHSVHAASADGVLLLPGATLTATCELCHDGTGGDGVYGTIAARGLTVQAAHRTESTNLVPGGDESTGGTSTATFSGLGGTLTCGDCHAAHGANTVAAFTTDRMRIATDTAGFVSNELLLRMPTSATTPTPVYGSDWCGSCHKGRVTGVHDAFNHPVDATSTANYFTYEHVQVIAAAGTTQTVDGSLGQENSGYVMPDPRTSGQQGHAPICQQCHADSRTVGDSVAGSVVASEAFTVTTPDGTTSSDNPRFQVFPHESAAQGMLVETGGDLCTNCHQQQ